MPMQWHTLNEKSNSWTHLRWKMTWILKCMHDQLIHTYVLFAWLYIQTSQIRKAIYYGDCFFFSSSPLCSSVASHISCYNLCFLAIEHNLLFLHIRFLIVFICKFFAYSSIISDFTIIFVISFGFRILIEIDEWERKTRMKRDKKWKCDFNVIDYNGSLFSFFIIHYICDIFTHFLPAISNQSEIEKLIDVFFHHSSEISLFSRICWNFL